MKRCWALRDQGEWCFLDMKLLNFKVKGSLEWLGGLILALTLLSPLGVLFLGSLNQNLGWGPILVSLQVPELTIEEFLQECLSLGSYLTLYVYLLQCLNSEQTLRNEMKVLLLISKWLEQVYPRYADPPVATANPQVRIAGNLGLD